MAEKFACPICLDKRHVPTSRGSWKACVCSKHFVELARILPSIRGREEHYPPEYDKLPPYPLADVAVGGGGMLQFMEEYREFRYMVWRSLLGYTRERPDLTYDMIDAIRVSTYWFGEDDAYKNTGLLEELDLLILTFLPTAASVPRRAHPEIVAHTMLARQVAGRPTWLFIPDVSSEASRALYGPTLLAMFPPLLMPTGKPRPTTTALVKQRKKHRL